MSAEIEPDPARDARLAALEAENEALRQVLEGVLEQLSFDDGAYRAWERLRDTVDGITASPTSALSAYRARVLAEAAQACEGAAADYLPTSSDRYNAYGLACADCAAAVRRLGEER